MTKELKRAIRECEIFNTLYDSIEESRNIASLHAVLTHEDFKKNFDFMSIKSNRQLLIDMIDEKIELFQARMLATDKIYEKLKKMF